MFSTLKYGGITFENYRGWIGGGTDSSLCLRPRALIKGLHY